MAMPRTPVTVVLRVGRTGLALAAVDRNLEIRARREAPSPLLAGAPYPALDHHHIWRWLEAVLEDMAERYRVETIVPTAFGATVALVDDKGLVLPMMHPDATAPAHLRAAFVADAPAVAAVGMATPAAGTTVALQLYWQKRLFAEAFARARWLLSHAAFWGFRLTGGALACEAASLIEGGQLIEVASRRPATLARREGWQLRLASLRDPHCLLGRVAPEIAARTGLEPDTRVLVGTSDRAAAHALLLAASLDDAALLLADERVLLSPSTGSPDAGVRTVSSVDRRTLTEVTLDADAQGPARALAALDHRGPLVIAGTWPRPNALAQALERRGNAVFALDDPALWAPGAAFLALLDRRPPVPRLPLRRVATACDEMPGTAS